MIFNIRKIIVRAAVILVMASVLGYIFWPQSNTNTLIPNTTSETISKTTVLPIRSEEHTSELQSH